MDISKLKLLEKRVQIITAIEKATAFGGEMWQSNSKGRQILQIFQIYIDIKSDKVIFNTLGMIEVDPRLPIFIRLSYRNIIFRLDPTDFRIMGDKLICDYPKVARGLVERNGDRYVLPINSEISISLKKMPRTLKDNGMDLEVRIVDASQNGFGILISGANRDFLKINDHFVVKAIDHRSLPRTISGTVTYVSPKGYYLQRGDVRVGLSLQSSIPNELFQLLKKKCHLILSA